MALDLHWIGCDLVTGRIVEDLPDLRVNGSISSVLAQYTSAQMQLPLALAGQGRPPLDWRVAVEPSRSMIVAVLAGNPVWAGLPLGEASGSADTAGIACVSIEGYLDRRYVGDHEWTDQDASSVVGAGLVGDANTEGIGLIVDAPAMGVLRTHAYADKDDKSVYSALRELMGEGGPEWTISLRWSNSTQTVVEKVAVLRERIGMASTIPSAVFDARAAATFDSVGSSSATYEYRVDYSSGKGANHVVATSSGQGDARPQSAPARDEGLLASGMPRWEYRWQPGSNITDQASLDRHAQSAVALMARGGRTLSITARADAEPILGTHWGMGDDIGYDLVGHAHPEGLKGVARAVGWSLDPEAGTVQPILLLPGQEVS